MEVTIVTYVAVMILLFLGGFLMLEFGLFYTGEYINTDKTKYQQYTALCIAGGVFILLGFIWQHYMTGHIKSLGAQINI
jgi:hypothetical protein